MSAPGCTPICRCGVHARGRPSGVSVQGGGRRTAGSGIAGDALVNAEVDGAARVAVERVERLMLFRDLVLLAHDVLKQLVDLRGVVEVGRVVQDLRRLGELIERAVDAALQRLLHAARGIEGTGKG